ncbi:MAG: DNA-binding protein WhiA [Clostridia bacterium]
MSFSSEVKEEISKITNLANKQSVKFELLGYLASSNVTIEKNKLKFSTESEYNINRFSKLLNNLLYTNYQIEVIGKLFCITVNRPESEEVTYEETAIILNEYKIKEQLKNQELLEKAFIRGAFLGGGSINNPQNTYHLEILLSSSKNVKLILEILEKYNILFKNIEKKKGYAIYTKDGDEISKFLALIGANSAVLKFEDIRVYRDMRNNVNRKVNCETANLNKTINAAVKQIEDIKLLQKNGELKKLSKQLQEIAEVRLKNPDASLIELGKMLSKPIGKSGVNHRLKTIEEMAEKFK